MSTSAALRTADRPKTPSPFWPFRWSPARPLSQTQSNPVKPNFHPGARTPSSARTRRFAPLPLCVNPPVGIQRPDAQTPRRQAESLGREPELGGVMGQGNRDQRNGCSFIPLTLIPLTSARAPQPRPSDCAVAPLRLCVKQLFVSFGPDRAAAARIQLPDAQTPGRQAESLGRETEHGGVMGQGNGDQWNGCSSIPLTLIPLTSARAPQPRPSDCAFAPLRLCVKQFSISPRPDRAATAGIQRRDAKTPRRIQGVRLTTKPTKHTKMGTKPLPDPDDFLSPNGGQHYRNAPPHFWPENVLGCFRVVRVFRGSKQLFRLRRAVEPPPACLCGGQTGSARFHLPTRNLQRTQTPKCKLDTRTGLKPDLTGDGPRAIESN